VGVSPVEVGRGIRLERRYSEGVCTSSFGQLESSILRGACGRKIGYK